MVLEQARDNHVSLNDRVLDQQQSESPFPTLPQRKKPGRKPNPASPTLRKAQNRAAQRAFRERKERHLRDLEDTIKTQRDKQHESDITHQKELQQLRSMIENLENEKRYWKEVSLTFELALNHIHGNAEITSKIKATLMNSARVLLPTPISMSNGQPVAGLFGFVQQQQQDHNRFTLGVDNHRPKMLDAPEPLSANLQSVESFLPSPTNSSTVLSPLTTPSSLRVGSISPQTTTYSFNDDQTNDKTGDTDHTTSTITSSYLTEDYLDSLMKNYSGDYGQVFPVYQQTGNQNTEIVSLKHSDPITQQLISLAHLVGAQDLSGVEPKVRYPLTTQQMYYLQQPHDPRIDMIPCLHLRSRMIQHRDSYDMYELCDLLIKKAKCHGEDPLDPDAWEMPEEFFDKYNFLSFSQCRIKSTLYRLNPRLPTKHLSDMLKKRASVYLVS